MKKLISILILLGFIIFNSFGQRLDKDYIDNWILKTFPDSKIDNDVLYILNGLMIGNETLNIELSKYNRDGLTTINFIDKATIDSLTFCKPLNGIVILVSKGQQSWKSIKNDLKIAKGKFKESKVKTTSDIDSRKGDPVLIINGKQIFYQDCFSVINRLYTKDLIGINIINKPVSKDIYGSNAENGLIIITKK